MNRLAFVAGRNLCFRGGYKAVGMPSDRLRQVTIQKRYRNNVFKPSHLPDSTLLNEGETYSTKASELKTALPKLWISKMRTAFAWLDVDGDGYLTEKDFEAWLKEISEQFPNMNQEQKNILASKKNSVWNNLWDGMGKAQISEDMYIERFYNLATQEGGEDMIRKEWEKNFAMIDVNKDGNISKSEHQSMFVAWKHDPVGAIVAFRAIDKNMDGVITSDEFVEAATEFFLNFTDEEKSSKYFFGPLIDKF